MNYSSDSLLMSEVRSIRNVGPRRAEELNKAKIYTLLDLLYYFPRQYQDRSNLKHAGACNDGEVATIRGVVLNVSEQRPRRGLTLTKLALHDGLGVFYGVFYNQPFIKNNIPVGAELYVTGKIDRGFGAIQLIVEDYEMAADSDPLSAERIVPIYPLAGKLNQRLLRNLTKGVLELLPSDTGEFIPRKLLLKTKLPALPAAWQAIHYPDSPEMAEKARERFIFEELFLYQLALLLNRQELTGRVKSHNYSAKGRLIKAYLRKLPFNMTGGQARVWEEIRRDMLSPAPMYRLLHGEVGSGKTVIAVLALLMAAENNLQGALMAPTEVLAEQHFLSIKESLAPLQVEIALLTGRMAKKEKAALLEKIAAGETQIVIGTHALIQEQVRFNQLGLIIIDEQHRFGVRQRAVLQDKGLWPDVLVMTATPIPRTLALTLYGDLDISMIDELPPGRLPVQTFAVPPRLLPRAYNFLREQVAAGRQAFIICPLVRDSEKLTCQSVESLAEKVAGQEFKDYEVGMLHGRLPSPQKEAVMAAFRRGELDILASTTVVEVGVDVPNATVMIILDAERFGLAQLHQLRGRVGRGAEQSYCVLVAAPQTPEGRSRIKAMTASNDGFFLAEEDLNIRGPGELSGTKQTGLPELKIADLRRDWPVLLHAREEALALLAGDPGRQKKENQILLEAATRLYGGLGWTM